VFLDIVGMPALQDSPAVAGLPNHPEPDLAFEDFDPREAVTPSVLRRMGKEVWTLDQSRRWNAFRYNIRLALQRYPDGIPFNRLVRVRGLNRSTLKECQRVLGHRSVWDLLNSVPDLMTVKEDPSKPEKGWFFIPSPLLVSEARAAAPAFLPVEEAPFSVPPWATVGIPPAPGEIDDPKRGVHPQYAALHNTIARTLRDHPDGLPLRRFAYATRLLPAAARILRQPISLADLVPMLEAMPDLVRLVLLPGADFPHVYPADADLPASSTASNEVAPPETPSTAPVDTTPDPHAQSSTEASALEVVASTPGSTAAPRPMYFAQFRSPVPSDEADPTEQLFPVDDLTDLSDVRLLDVGPLPPVARFWTHRQVAMYNDFRARVTDNLRKRCPHGCAAQHFVVGPGLRGIRSRRRRLELGYATIWDLVRSMPDLIRLDDTKPLLRDWRVYPAGATPAREVAVLNAVIDETADQANEESDAVVTPTDGSFLPVAAIEPDEVLTKDNVAYAKIMAAFREKITSMVWRYPEGANLLTISMDASLGARKWKELLKAIGYKTLADLLLDMPEIVTLVKGPSEDLRDWMVYPASRRTRPLVNDRIRPPGSLQVRYPEDDPQFESSSLEPRPLRRRPNRRSPRQSDDSIRDDASPFTTSGSTWLQCVAVCETPRGLTAAPTASPSANCLCRCHPRRPPPSAVAAACVIS